MPEPVLHELSPSRSTAVQEQSTCGYGGTNLSCSVLGLGLSLQQLVDSCVAETRLTHHHPEAEDGGRYF